MTDSSFKLIKGNSEDIGFASTYLSMGVINFDEFKQWLYFVIENSDDVPAYIFDILDIDDRHDYTLRIKEVIGFHASWQGEESEENALGGLAYKRHSNYLSDAVSREDALVALKQHPYIEHKFRKLFPFVNLA